MRTNIGVSKKSLPGWLAVEVGLVETGLGPVMITISEIKHLFAKEAIKRECTQAAS